ncbi:MAG: YfhO family protein, partial [Actinobacteria bacterium]|nr:YfhO family protein [Actinomycetota bacterium]
PTIANQSLARLYGIRYLYISTYFPGALKLMNRPLKSGFTLVARGTGFEIVRVAGVHRFISTTGSVKAVHWQGDNQVTIDIHAYKPGELIAKISALPGWHATVNGKPVRVVTTGNIFLTVVIPKGASTVTLDYLPAAFSDGIIAAAVGILIIAILLVVDLHRYRAMPRK